MTLAMAEGAMAADLRFSVPRPPMRPWTLHTLPDNTAPNIPNVLKFIVSKLGHKYMILTALKAIIKKPEPGSNKARYSLLHPSILQPTDMALWHL